MGLRGPPPKMAQFARIDSQIRANRLILANRFRVPELQKRSGDPNPYYFSKSTAVQMGGRTAVQMGGVLRYKWEAYCRVSLSSKLSSQESTAIQMYCRTFQTSCRGWGFRNIAQN